MRINDKIRKAGEFNPTKKTHQMSISEMCIKIKNNKITLPLYQRDLSWTLKKSVDLFNYQLFGKAPVSPISINQISETNEVPQISFLNREIILAENIKADHQSVVDGQQRLSTNFKAFVGDEDFKNIVLDVARAKFMLVEGKLTSSQIPVNILLNEDEKLLEEYINKNYKNEFAKLFPVLTQVRSKMKNYNYTINIAENLTEDEQIEWFEVLNNAGSRVSALQMSFSKLKIHGVDIYKDYTHPFKELVNEYYEFKDFFIPFTTNVSYPIATLNPAYEVILKNGIHNNNYAPIPSDTKEKALTQLDHNTLSKIFDLTLTSLKQALEFIEKEDLEDYITRIDYILYLTGYFCFHHDVQHGIDRSKLIDWIEKINFSNMSNSMRRKEFTELITLK